MKNGRAVADRIGVGIGLLLLWQAASLAVGEYWISSPWVTLQTLWAGVASGEMLRHGAYTMGAALAGFVLGGVPAVWLALWLRRHALVRDILDPFLVAGYGLPKLALAPLFILWLGIGIGAKVVLVASVVFFLVFFTTQSGVQAVDGKLIQMARVAGANHWRISRSIVWPSVLPFVFAGIRISTPYAIGGVVISELISSNRGLGYLVQLGASNFSTKDVFAAVAAITLLTGAGSWLVDRVERSALKWRRPVDSDTSAAV